MPCSSYLKSFNPALPCRKHWIWRLRRLGHESTTAAERRLATGRGARRARLVSDIRGYARSIAEFK